MRSSQWFPARFQIEGQSYPSAEHFMMVRKAQLFGSTELARQILATPDPGKAKALGRMVRNFDEER